MELSRLETLLDAMCNGEQVDITPQSRHEELLLCLLKGEQPTLNPQSRLETYLVKICEQGLGGGSGDNFINGNEVEY